jgi:hypothetical protein
MEVRVADSTMCTMCKVRERSRERSRVRPSLGMRFVTVVVGGVRGSGMRAVCGVFRRRRRTKGWRLLGSKPEPENRRGDVVHVIRSLIMILSR